MKRHVFISIMFLCGVCTIKAQSSVSVNYLYLGSKEKYAANSGVVRFEGISKGLTNKGINIQGKIRLVNRLHIMADAGFFFKESEKIKTPSAPTDFRENEVRYYTANANLAYAFLSRKYISVSAVAGLGYFHESSRYRIHREGTPWSDITPDGHTVGGEINAITAWNGFEYGSPVGNLGVNAELYLSEHLFLAAGLKYIYDLYDPQYNGFPHINLGIGYAFR